MIRVCRDLKIISEFTLSRKSETEQEREIESESESKTQGYYGMNIHKIKLVRNLLDFGATQNFNPLYGVCCFSQHKLKF